MRSRDVATGGARAGRPSPGFFTIPASDRERKRSETCLGNLIPALETVAIRALIEAAQGSLDFLQCFRLHLNQRELDLILGVDLRDFAFIEHLVLARVIDSRTADPALDILNQRTPAIFEHHPEFRRAAPFDDGDLPFPHDVCGFPVNCLLCTFRRAAPLAMVIDLPSQRMTKSVGTCISPPR